VLIKLHSVVVADEFEVCETYNTKQMNLLYRGVKWLSTNSAVWEVQVFLLSTTPQKCTFDRRCKDLSGRTARLTSQWSTDGQSQRKFENKRCTATSRQKRRVNIYREISTFSPFFSIAYSQLAVETVKYI